MSDAEGRFVLPYEAVPDPTPMNHDEREWPVSDHIGVLGGAFVLPDHGEAFGMLRFGFGRDPLDHSVAATTFIADETSLRLLRGMMNEAIDGALASLAEAKRG